MPMNLGLQYGAARVVPELLKDVLKQRMLEREMQRRLAEDAAEQEAQRKRLALEQQRVGYEGERLGLEKRREGRLDEIHPINVSKLTTEAAAAEYDLSEKEKAATLRDFAKTTFINNPEMLAAVRAREAGVDTKPIDPTDPGGDKAFERAQELERQRGENTARTANIYASGAGNRDRWVIDNKQVWDPEAGVTRQQTVAINPHTLEYKLVGPAEFKAPPAALIGRQQEFDVLLKQAQAVNDLYYGGPNGAPRRDLIGPWIGNIVKGGSKVGMGSLAAKTIGGLERVQSQDARRLHQMVSAYQNMLLYARTGKQINNEEFRRMMKELPEISQEWGDFEVNLERSITNMEMINQRMRSGYTAPVSSQEDADFLSEYGSIVPDRWKSRLYESQSSTGMPSGSSSYRIVGEIGPEGSLR